MMGKKWFYANGEKTEGPASESSLIQMISCGEISQDTLVWTEGMTNWTSASNIVVQPQRTQAQNVIECPKCGANNHLNPEDDTNALRCGKCNGELGLNPFAVASIPERNDSAVITEPARFKLEDAKSEKERPSEEMKMKIKAIYPVTAVVALLLFLIVFVGQRDYTRFMANNNGTVSDTRTGLMWAAKDNGNSINWANAKRYCENYRGGGYWDWRMPTAGELAGLYDASKSRPGGLFIIHVATELIDITDLWFWASETSGSNAAYFRFANGKRGWDPQSSDISKRVLPVRSGK